MATRRYRKRKKSLKKRVSRRRKNVRSSRRMRGGMVCNPQPPSYGRITSCKYDFKVGEQYTDPNDAKIYTFLKYSTYTKDNVIYFFYIFKDNQKQDEIIQQYKDNQIDDVDENKIKNIDGNSVINDSKIIISNNKSKETITVEPTNLGYVKKYQPDDSDFLDRIRKN